MSDMALHDVLRRAEAWTAEDRRKLVEIAQIIEAQREGGFELTTEDWSIIAQRAASGDIASEAETSAFFAKYRAA